MIEEVGEFSRQVHGLGGAGRNELFVLAVVDDALLQADMDDVYFILSDFHSLIKPVKKPHAPLKDGSLSTLHPFLVLLYILIYAFFVVWRHPRYTVLVEMLQH